MKITRARLFQLVVILFTPLTALAAAATDVAPIKPANITYSITPDLRRCPSPLCGGWFITPVNMLTMGLLSETETLKMASAVSPAAMYVADLEFSCTQWSEAEKAEFAHAALQGAALVSGQMIERPSAAASNGFINLFVVRDAFTAASKNLPVGPYLSVQPSGITCVTTPCPYFSADVVNSNMVYEFHDLTFAKAGLSAEEEQAARAQLASGALLVTGVAGQTGAGTGINVTQVFWAYPPKKN